MAGVRSTGSPKIRMSLIDTSWGSLPSGVLGAASLCGRQGQAAPCQIPPKVARVGEQDGVESSLSRSLDVARAVVDEDAAVQTVTDPFPEDGEDREVGFGDAHLARHHDVLEQVQEVEAFKSHRKELLGPVGQGIERYAGCVQLAHDLDGVLN